MSAVGVRVRRRAPAAARASRALAALAGRPGPLLAASLVGAWMIVYPRTPDLAAQAYRVDLFHHFGFALWDNNWYAGHHLPGYSLLFPPVAGLLGVRLLGALSVLTSALLFADLVGERHGRGAAVASAWFALAAACDLWIGRITFALGVTLGLAAVAATARGWRVAGGVLGALCAAASPVAGLFLVLAGAAHVLATRKLRPGVVLGAPALAVVVVVAALFPEGGREPYVTASFLTTSAAALAFAALVQPEPRVLRIGAILYLVAVVVSMAASTPMGGNVARLAILLAAPLLLWSSAGSDAGRGALSRRRGVILGLALLGLGTWTVYGPVRELRKVSGDPSVNAAFYRPVVGFLAAHATVPGRVEVPFTRSHWEATLLGGRFALARGWERQLDIRYDPLFFSGPLTAAAYHAWLRQTAVRYVALPDVALDGSSVGEARLIRSGVPYLRPAWSNAHWRVYEVTDARPLVSGPGALTALLRDGFVLRADAPGRFLVRVHFSRYWTVTRGAGCVTSTPDGWTSLTATRAGVIDVAARFSVGRALGEGGGCAPARA